MGHSQIKKFCALDTSGQEMLRHAMEDLQLSARAYARILKVARTIADLAGEYRFLPRRRGDPISHTGPQAVGVRPNNYKSMNVPLLSCLDAASHCKIVDRQGPNPLTYPVAADVRRLKLND
jgi:hypothetical protein